MTRRLLAHAFQGFQSLAMNCQVGRCVGAFENWPGLAIQIGGGVAIALQVHALGEHECEVHVVDVLLARGGENLHGSLDVAFVDLPASGFGGRPG